MTHSISLQPIISNHTILCKCENCQREPKFLKHTYTEFRPENHSWKNRTIWYPNPRYIHNRAIIRKAGTLYPNPTRVILCTYRGFRISIPASFNLPKTFHHDKVITDYHQYIDDYYQRNDNIMKRKMAFPYHHSLIQLSLLLSSTRFIHSAYGMHIPYVRQSIHHTKPLTSITMLKSRQRAILLGFSGITGLLIPRLLGQAPYWQRRTFASMGTHIVRRIHSPIACEIMLDNRYSDFITEKNALVCCELNDVPINQAKRLLRVVYYDGHTLSSLKKDIVDFKKGEISIDTIYKNQKYQYLYTYWFYCLSESMSYHNHTDSERQQKCLPKESMFQKTKRIIRIITEFSEMLSPDIVFIMKTNRLAYTIKNTQLRLSKDGCFAAFLAYTKLEPLMVDDMMAPIIGTQYTGITQNDVKTNWIPSKDRVFGDLILKHREHLPTTANVNNIVCRHNLVENRADQS